MAEENKPGGDLNDIRSQTDDLLKSLDSVDNAPKSPPKSSSTGSTRDFPPAKPPAQKSSSSSIKTILVAAGSLAGIAVVIIGGLVALEASKQATLNRQAELAAQEARANRETAARVQAELARERENAARELAERERAAKEQAEKEQAAREQADREQAARERAARELAAREREASERAAREQAARDRAARERKEAERLASLRRQLIAKGWKEIGSSGLLHRYCDIETNDASLGASCAMPSGRFKRWFGVEVYCLSTSCSGLVAGSFGDRNWNQEITVSIGYIALEPEERRFFRFTRNRDASGYNWISQAAGFCRRNSHLWEKC